MKLRIDPWDKNSVSAALKQMEEYQKDFQQKEAEFVRRLKDIGLSVATTGFALADYDGENDVLVTHTQNKNRALVIAYGKTVGFIEFGTGVKYPEYDSSDLEFTPPPHGSYGKGKGKNPKGWFFGSGRHSYGNPPAEAMLTARDAMIEQIVQIAKEVWR